MACSRMPKCRLRPPWLSASKSPAPSNVSRVLVDGARSAEPPISHGTFFASGVEHLAGGVARGHALGVGREGRQVLVPALGQLAVLHPVELVGQLGVLGLRYSSKLREPGVAQLLAALADAVAEVLVDAVGDEELGVLRPAVVALGQPDFLLAERLAVGGAGVLLVRRALADVAVDDDQRRPVARLLEDAEGPVEHVQVVGVADARDVPAVADEARGHVLAEGQVRVAFDGDVVVVVDPAQVGELQVPGERGGLAARCPPSCSRRRTGRRRRSRTVSKPGRLKWAASQRPAIAMPTLLASPWPSGPVVVSTPVVQRYSGWPGHLLSSWRKCLMSSSGTDGSPSVSYFGLTALTPVRCSSEYSSIEAWPADSTKRSRLGQIGSLRVEAQEVLPQDVGQRGHAHRRAGVAGVGRLHGVHRTACGWC